MANELLPCPFCGGPAEIYNPFHMIGKPSQPATYRGGVRCRACGCESKATTPPDGAITAWNRRADAAPQASAEGVRKPIMTVAEFCTEADRIGLTADTLAAQLAQRPEFADCLPQADKDGGQQREGGSHENA